MARKPLNKAWFLGGCVGGGFLLTSDPGVQASGIRNEEQATNRKSKNSKRLKNHRSFKVLSRAFFFVFFCDNQKVSIVSMMNIFCAKWWDLSDNPGTTNLCREILPVDHVFLNDQTLLVVVFCKRKISWIPVNFNHLQHLLFHVSTWICLS